MASAKKKSNEKGTSTRRGRVLGSPRSPRFVVCVDNSHYPASLEVHKIYRVLIDNDAARDGDLRLIDESGEDYLYPAEWFVPIEPPSKVRASLVKASSSAG